MLQKWKLKQLNTKAILGEEYNDYNLVMTSEFGSPLESGTIRVSFNKLIEEHHLPKVVFHSLRHPYVKPTTKKYLFFLVPMIQLS